MMSEFPIRLYRHLKTGKVYQIIAESAWVEGTQEQVVVYKSLGDGLVWTRPYEQFHEKFELAGQITK